ncbi:MAG TPA: hypothetical protein VMH85_19500 [Terriglobales bacterium]|nr:hypothetical protein [Terriglobales bacterium]
MSTGGLGLSSTTSISNPAHDLAVMRARAEQIVKTGAGWFIWIAGLSLINSLITAFDGNFHFIFGLGITTIVDAVARNAGRGAAIPGLVIDLFVAGVFAVFWHFGRKGGKWAFIVGMALYALDGVLLLLFRDFLGAAFHVYALFMLYRGLAGTSMLEKCRRAELFSGAAIEPR